MFRGRFVHTIDSKNRMSLPAGFRSELQRRSDRPPILTNAHQCLELHPFEDWQVFEERIVGIATIDPEAQAYARMMVSGAVECPIDKQGRILVPQHLREYAGLERDVTVAGVGPKIELWNSARFETNLIQTQARFEEMAISLAAKLGN
jgi:transcriptional regulator MraZ